MILTCPACGTQYVVKDDAIPPGGRQVRCASCRHSWHQDPGDPGSGDAEQDTVVAAEGIAPPLEQSSEDTNPDQSGDVARASAYDADESQLEAVGAPEQAVSNADEEQPLDAVAPDAEDEFTPFAVGEAAEPRRRSPAFAVLVALVLIAAAAAAFYYLAPAEWKARIGLADAGSTPLQLMMTHSDRQRLASGNELLAISGRVINPTQEKQSVPPITAQLRDAKGNLVYSWTIAPPAPTLKAGDSASFYSAEVNVPAGGNELTVTLGAPKA